MNFSKHTDVVERDLTRTGTATFEAISSNGKVFAFAELQTQNSARATITVRVVKGGETFVGTATLFRQPEDPLSTVELASVFGSAYARAVDGLAEGAPTVLSSAPLFHTVEDGDFVECESGFRGVVAETFSRRGGMWAAVVGHDYEERVERLGTLTVVAKGTRP